MLQVPVIATVISRGMREPENDGSGRNENFSRDRD